MAVYNPMAMWLYKSPAIMEHGPQRQLKYDLNNNEMGSFLFFPFKPCRSPSDRQ